MPNGIPLKRPPIFDPEQKSVFDSGPEKLARRVIEFFGGGEPADEVANMVGIMPLGSPIRNVSRRAARLADLAKQARELSPHIGEAFDHLARRFPLVMGHITKIAPTADPHTIGQFHPQGMGSPGALKRGMGGTIELNPEFIPNTSSAVEVLAHEMTHGGQALRLGDRHSRALAAGRTALKDPQNFRRLDDLDHLPPDLQALASYITPEDIARAEFGPLVAGRNQADLFRFPLASRPGTMPKAEMRRRSIDSAASSAEDRLTRQLFTDSIELAEMLAPLKKAPGR